MPVIDATALTNLQALSLEGRVAVCEYLKDGKVLKRQVVNDKIEVGVRGVISTFLPLSNQTDKEFEMTKKSIAKVCSVDGCEKKGTHKGICMMHYSRYRRYQTFERIANRVYGKGDTDAAKFWSRAAITADPTRCWLWLGAKDKDGYGVSRIKRRKLAAHRHAYFLTHKQLTKGLCILHSCNNPPCVNPDHLSEGTHKENTAYKVLLHRQAAGSSHGMVKLTVDDVINIRRRYAEGGITYFQLAEAFNTDFTNIGMIVRHETWRHLP